MSKLNASIYLVEKDIDFNRIRREIVSKNKNKEEMINQLPDDEKYYYHQLVDDKDWKYIRLPFLLKDIGYKLLTAKIESPKKRIFNKHGILLPKNERLNLNSVELFLLNIDGNCFLVILTSNETNKRRILNLIGNENIKNNHKYNIDNEIFNWMMYIYTEQNSIITDNIFLKNVIGFVGNITDETNVFSGDSLQTTELIVTKAFISNGGTLKRIGVRVLHQDIIDIVFSIDEKSAITIFSNKSEDLSLLNGASIELGKDIYYMLYIYTFLIEKIIQVFKRESDKYLEEKKSLYSKKIGIEVINSIRKINNISIEELY